MPIYEYQCSKCGEIFEAFQKFSDEPLKECRFCGGKVEKLISHSSFQLKGSGWYLTDYSRKTSCGTAPDKPKTETETPKAAEKPKTSTECGGAESKK
ncbi:MAG: zinc ribbon domain-containing protein [Acidobacteria bacterium]|nr:zinc ribbon domain-containing protein [Acidobacteriota bacterium]